MTVTAALVKELRERTGAGMMECKKALTETAGDIDAAVENMRKAGLAKADKKAGRVAAEGRVAMACGDNRAAMVEINCETDFVANGDDFAAFAGQVAGQVLAGNPADAESLDKLPLGNGKDVDTARRELVAKLGENIGVRRYERFDAGSHQLGSYVHGTRIGVLVEVKGGTPELARDLAMHIAASKPVCVNAADVSAELLDKERDIIRAQSAESGKPADIIEKMVEGRIRKYLAEITLLGQPFVKDPDQTVEKLLARAGAEVLRFTRFEVGEGIEKKQEDFAAEVRAQAAKA